MSGCRLNKPNAEAEVASSRVAALGFESALLCGDHLDLLQIRRPGGKGRRWLRARAAPAARWRRCARSSVPGTARRGDGGSAPGSRRAPAITPQKTQATHAQTTPSWSLRSTLESLKLCFLKEQYRTLMLSARLCLRVPSQAVGTEEVVGWAADALRGIKVLEADLQRAKKSFPPKSPVIPTVAPQALLFFSFLPFLRLLLRAWHCLRCSRCWASRTSCSRWCSSRRLKWRLKGSRALYKKEKDKRPLSDSKACIKGFAFGI